MASMGGRRAWPGVPGLTTGGLERRGTGPQIGVAGPGRTPGGEPGPYTSQPYKESTMASLQVYDPFADTGFDELFRGFFQPVRGAAGRASPAPIKVDVSES